MERMQEDMTNRTRADGCAERAVLLPALCLFVFASQAMAFQITPANPEPGEQIILDGTAGPGEEVSFQSSFSMNLPVSNGQYEYETHVEVPQKPNRFTVSAGNVEQFNAGIKIGIWITKGFTPSGGRVSLSQADVLPGHYNLKMFGKALAGASSVPVTVQAETAVKADSTGRYRLAIDTTGIPAGDYVITGDGETKTVRLGGAGSSISSVAVASGATGSASSGSSAGSSGPSAAAGSSASSTGPIGVTRETVLWYAGLMGLDASNSSQYGQAEEQLERRLSEGYWKIIRRGEPLTEEAGDCMQEYCLVRGTDACTVCRDKDIILKGGRASGTDASGAGRQATGITGAGANATGNAAQGDAGRSQAGEDGADAEQKGFLSSVADWIYGLLGILGALVITGIL